MWRAADMGDEPFLERRAERRPPRAALLERAALSPLSGAGALLLPACGEKRVVASA